MSFRPSLFGGVALATLATLGGVLVSRAEPAARGRAAVFTYAPDTTPLFGAKRFNAPGSGSTIYTERFLAVAGSAYLLRVENGAPDGTGRVSTGTIRLNSAAILSPSDFAGSPALLTRYVQLTSSDTLKVELSAGSGQFVTVSVLAAPNARFPIHGPTLVTVTQGSQVTVNDNFSLPGGASGPFRVHVVNGPDGTTRVSNATVTINGTDVLTQTDINANIAAVERAVTLTSSNTVSIKVKQSSVGNRLSIRFTATDTTRPALTLTAPAQNALTGNTSITVSGSIADQTATAVTVNGTTAPLDATGGFSVNAPLGNEGQNTLTITAIDANGNRTDSTRSITRDTQPPNFDVYHPIPGLVTQASTEFSRGPVSDLTAVTVTANGAPQALTGDGFFQDEVALVPGVNDITYVATDALGHSTTIVRTVVRDNTAPTLTVTEPADNSTTMATAVAVSGTATDATALGVTVNGDPVSLDGSGAFSTSVALAEGLNAITVVATDAAGNTSTVVRNVSRETEPLPPDPASVAPPLDRTVATTMAAATEFLYTGANPIQADVAAGTIDPTRIAVLRGAVKKRDGSALTGVEITVLDHPEFGRTLSRADGAFDIAVNGGGLLTVNYMRDGFLPVQRQVDATQQRYDRLEDVVLIPRDTAATAIDFTQSIELHRGSVMTDGDGSRRATVFFEQGTEATMTLPDGTTEPLSSLTVRATEYSVGETGPLALPASLPGTAAHTYAVDLGVDEALAAGATSVEFSKPVVVYVENFLKLPVGLRLPLAFADQSKGTWVPMANGTIIKIVGISGGLADISVDTAGTVADSATLAALGMTIAEREALANTFSVGETLWRLATTHFTGLGVFCPAGAQPPAPKPALPPGNVHVTKPPCENGSVIECTTQVLGEFIPVTGAPFDLSYRSLRTPGYQTAFQRTIHLTGDSISPTLLRVELEITLAGRRFDSTFAALPNQSMVFTWDGLDAYGRRVQGRQPLTATVRYVYPMLYEVPAAEAASFGLTCYGPTGLPFSSACFIPRGLAETPCKCRSEEKLAQDYQMMIGELDTEAERMGGWTASVHHTYDPVARVLYLGTGERREARDILTTVAGTGALGTAGDGGPATQAQLFDPNGIAVAPDGTIYVADMSRRIRRIDPDGIITTIAGTGQFGYSPDSTPALQADLGITSFTDLALGPDGTLYFTEPGLVRTIGADSILRTAAGDRAFGSLVCDESWEDGRDSRYSCIGDGGPATQAGLSGPNGIAVGPDGSLYIGDGNDLVRKVNTAGIITTIAGGGFASYPCDYGATSSPWASVPNCGDGESARNAGFDVPWDLAVGPDGSVYVTEAGNKSVRVIAPDGIVRRIAGDGTGLSGFSGDGGPATSARLNGDAGVALGPDGSLYIHQFLRIRRVSPQGIITTIAGTGSFAPECGTPTPPTCTSDQLATQTAINTNGGANRMAVGPDGSIYFGTYQGDHRIRRIVPFFRSYTATGIAIASDDGTEVYEFDATGRHLRTRDALTKRVLLAFTYDSAGRLAAVTDADGNVTTLERNTAGNLTTVVSPFGQRTAVTLDARGYLGTVTNPAGEVITAQHDTLGLLLSLRDAKNNPPQEFVYDSLGRLTRDTWPSGGFKTLTRTESDTSIAVSLTTALGRTTSYLQLRAPDGTDRRVDVDAAGLATVTEEKPNGTTVVAGPDSTVATLTETRDPRFGMQAPIASAFSVRLPSGLQLSGSSSRKATLANPNDPLSLTSQLDSLTVNGRTFTSLFDAGARTLTETSAEGRQTVTQLDTLGRVVEERTPGVAPVQYGYGPRGFLTTVTQAGRVLRYEYDSSGRVNQVTDPLGRFEQYAYDSVGRVVTQTLFNGSQILYGYDANGNLTSLTPPGRPAHTFAYTAANLDSIYSPPPAGLPVSATHYTFNLDHQLTRVLRPDSLAIDIAYDTAGRPSSLTLPTGQLQFAYSPTSGNLTQLTAPDGGTLSYTYDGALPKTVTWGGVVQGSVGFAYDSSFRVSKIAVNGTDSVAYGYDKDNLLTSAGAMTLVRDSLNGRLVRTVLGSDTSNWTYDDSTGAVTHYAAKHGATTLFDAVYTRDSLDRIVQLEETVQGVTTVKAYAYDSLGRLDQVRVNGVLTSDYDYDVNGNRTCLTTPSDTLVGTYDDQDRMLTYGGASYGYTANGELAMKVVGSDTTRYTYDVLGNLRQVRLPNGDVIDYLVDAQNRRIGKKVNGVLVGSFLYEGQLAPVADLDSNGDMRSRFVFGSRPNVPEFMIQGESTYRFVTDHLGSVRLVVNSTTGQVAQRIDYDEFGQVILDTSPGFQPFGYAGALFDAFSKLAHFELRDYDAIAGRWASKDPIGFVGGPMLFDYAAGDPVNAVDVLGTCTCSSILKWLQNAAGGGAIGGGAALGYATGFQNQTSKFGQAKLGKPTSTWPYWDRSFHFDGPHGGLNSPHFNAEFGPLTRFNHRPIPAQLYPLGSTRALRGIAAGLGAVGIALDAWDILTACDPSRAIGGVAGGLGGSAIGGAIGSVVPGVGTVIGGLVGGVIGSIIGQGIGGRR